MGKSALEYNTTSPVTGYNGTQPCISVCDKSRFSLFINSDILKLAPCPPKWNQELLWSVAKRKGLNDNDTDTIASRCVVPRGGVLAQVESKKDDGCGVSCVVLACFGCVLFLVIIKFGLQIFR